MPVTLQRKRKQPVNQTRWYTLTAVIAVLGLAAIAWGRVPADSEATALPPAPAIGHPAPLFTLPTLAGDELALADLHGRPVVLNFWASWCGPCRAEMPELQRLHERLVPVALDQRTGVSQQYLVNSLPTTFFIDRDGVIRSTFIGPMSDAVLAQNLRSIYP